MRHNADMPMAKITKTVGTGMTREGIIAFDWAEPDDVRARIDAAIEFLSRGSFILLSRGLTRACDEHPDFSRIAIRPDEDVPGRTRWQRLP